MTLGPLGSRKRHEELPGYAGHTGEAGGQMSHRRAIRLLQWGPLEVRSLDPFSQADQSPRELSSLLRVGTELAASLLEAEWGRQLQVPIQLVNLLIPFSGDPRFHSLQTVNPRFFLPQ